MFNAVIKTDFLYISYMYTFLHYYNSLLISIILYFVMQVPIDTYCLYFDVIVNTRL